MLIHPLNFGVVAKVIGLVEGGRKLHIERERERERERDELEVQNYCSNLLFGVGVFVPLSSCCQYFYFIFLFYFFALCFFNPPSVSFCCNVLVRFNFQIYPLHLPTRFKATMNSNIIECLQMVNCFSKYNPMNQ